MTRLLRLVLLVGAAGGVLLESYEDLVACAADGACRSATVGADILVAEGIEVRHDLRLTSLGDSRFALDGSSLSAWDAMGILSVVDAAVVLEDLVVRNGRVTELNSAGRLGGGGILVSNGTLTVENCSIEGNAAGFGGGGIYATDSDVALLRTTIRGNQATRQWDGDGGGLYASGSTVRVDACEWVSNSACSGGGVEVVSSDVTILNSTFSGNSAWCVAGALKQAGGTARILGSSFSGNSGSEGGAIYVDQTFLVRGSPASTTTIAESTFSSNGATYGAGAISVNGGIHKGFSGATLTIADSTLSGNAGGSMGVDGGAVYAELGTTVVVRRSAFDSNTVSGNGGAVFAQKVSTLDVSESSFTNNVGSGFNGGEGGAIYATEQSTISLDASTFAGNEASDARGNAVGCGYATTLYASRLRLDDASTFKLDAKCTAYLSQAGVSPFSRISLE